MTYTHFNKAIIRTPALPLSFFKKVFEPTTDIWEVIRQNDQIRIAIHYASPELSEQINLYLNNKIADSKKKEKLEKSVLKYLSRMSTRSTPFGTFSGISVVEESHQQNTQLCIPNANSDYNHVKVKFDMEFLYQLSDYVEKQEYVFPYLKYKPNNSLYKLGNKYRYVEVSLEQGGKSYDLSSVEYSEIIEELLKFSREGRYIHEMIDFDLIKDYSYEERSSFIKELIDAQIFMSELKPSTTGESHENIIISTLMRIDSECQGKNTEIQKLKKKIEDILNKVATLDNQNFENHTQELEELYQSIRSIGNLYFTKSKLLQADLIKEPNNSSFDSENIKIIYEAMDALTRLSLKGRENSELKAFKKSFAKRYENQWVPVADAVDMEYGIGYGDKSGTHKNYLVDDFQYTARNRSPLTKITWDNSLHDFWKDKILAGLSNHSSDIEITESELKKFPKDEKSLNATFCVSTSLVSNEENNKKIFLKYAGGPTANFLIGRFSTIDDQIKDLYHDIVDAEEKIHHDKIVAELNHLPQDRLGNVMHRANSRKYEIPYLVNSSVDQEYQIPISDLEIKLVNDEFILRSKQKKKEVLPYLSCALNYKAKGLPIFTFLAELQELQGTGSYALDLGFLPDFFERIPRINYKNIILRKASWKIPKSVIEALENTSSDHELLETWEKYTKEKEIPAFFSISMFDNEMMINSHHATSLKIFIEEAKKHSVINIQESILEEYKAIKDTDGNEYHNEMLYFFKKQIPAKISSNDIYCSEKELSAQRNYIIGSDWTYYNIYMGSNQSDKVLTDLKEELDVLVENKSIDKWFFIRYNDPDYHIRLRIFSNKQSSIPHLALNKVFNALYQDKRIIDISQNTYKRELERYGAKTIEPVESIFFHDSMMLTELLTVITHNYQNPEEIKWKAGIYIVHKYIEAFNISLEDACQYTSNVCDYFTNEFSFSRETIVQLDKDYNQKRIYYKNLIDEKKVEDIEEGEILFQIIDHYFSLIREEIILHQLSHDKLVESIIHMSVNRLFTNKQRLYEFSLYHILKRYYNQKINQNKVKKPVEILAK
ncbi:lantibiotic dehydratase [Chryseobacterium sp. Chry.R1]|uniref:lantibiotic dehydratase n=1 Tax=Chryseobacterium sp. Chry.R1 TaxID=3139392 RepID=UPI0031F934E9